MPYSIFPSSMPFLREHTQSYLTDFYAGCLSSDFKSHFFKDWSGSSPWMAPYSHLIAPAYMVRRFSLSWRNPLLIHSWEIKNPWHLCFSSLKTSGYDTQFSNNFINRVLPQAGMRPFKRWVGDTFHSPLIFICLYKSRHSVTHSRLDLILEYVGQRHMNEGKQSLLYQCSELLILHFLCPLLSLTNYD